MSFPIALILLSQYISGKGISIFILIIIAASTIAILTRLLLKYINSLLAKDGVNLAKWKHIKNRFLFLKNSRRKQKEYRFF